jgi:hypothetical protein
VAIEEDAAPPLEAQERPDEESPVLLAGEVLVEQ